MLLAGNEGVSMFSQIAMFFPEGSRGMERTVVMDKSKGEPVISVKTTSRSKERVSIASAFSSSAILDGGLMTTLIYIMKTLFGLSDFKSSLKSSGGMLLTL